MLDDERVNGDVCWRRASICSNPSTDFRVQTGLRTYPTLREGEVDYVASCCHREHRWECITWYEDYSLSTDNPHSLMRSEGSGRSRLCFVQTLHANRSQRQRTDVRRQSVVPLYEAFGGKASEPFAGGFPAPQHSKRWRTTRKLNRAGSRNGPWRNSGSWRNPYRRRQVPASRVL